MLSAYTSATIIMRSAVASSCVEGLRPRQNPHEVPLLPYYCSSGLQTLRIRLSYQMTPKRSFERQISFKIRLKY